MRHGQPGHGAQESASTMADSSAVLLELVLLPAYARCASIVMTRPNMIYIYIYIYIDIFFHEVNVTPTHQPAKVSPSAERVPPSVHRPTMEIIASLASGGLRVGKMRISAFGCK